MNHALLTDLYELTMGASYFARGMNDRATFDLFVRSLPPQRNFLVACGLEQALDHLESFHLDESDLDYLASLEMFEDDFLDHLRGLRFSGDVWAAPEGEVMFAGEPLISITAPLIEAQIFETYLLNCITLQTMIASKAARVTLACRDRTFVDFSARRDHGADAALKVARAAFIAGAASTSNVLAGKLFGIPVAGTMAHSYVMAFEDEIEAFKAFARDFPERAVLLIDTFDTEEGARRAAGVARELAAEGIVVRGVRIDSGDVGRLAASVRKILDDAGLGEMQIVISGDMDEYRIEELLDGSAPVDAFGVGTRMGTSADAPWLGSVYKLVADAGGPKMKTSTGKATVPGCKQVYRVEVDGAWDHDLVALQDEEVAGRPLLRLVAKDGKRTGPPEPLSDLRERCRNRLAALPEPLRSLAPADPYPVRSSDALATLVARIREEDR